MAAAAAVVVAVVPGVIPFPFILALMLVVAPSPVAVTTLTRVPRTGFTTVASYVVTRRCVIVFVAVVVAALTIGIDCQAEAVISTGSIKACVPKSSGFITSQNVDCCVVVSLSKVNL